MRFLRFPRIASSLTCALFLLADARSENPITPWPSTSAASSFLPDPASVQRCGPAYRFPQAGWIVLHIEGEPYERGYQHGKLLANEIAAHLRCFAATLSATALAENWPATRRLVNALFLRRYAKEYLEEMKGIADGASEAGARLFDRNIDLVDIAVLNCWPEIETLDSALEATPIGLEGMRFPHAQPRAMPKPRPEHCSAFAATAPATADGKIVFGHITMFGLYPANYYNVWLDIKPAKGRRVLMCAYPGAMQSGMDYYLNDAGILIAETTIGQTRFDIQGTSEASRIREAIQYATTIDQAVAILKKDNNGLYTNEWLLADINTNEIALFELGTHKSKLHRSSKQEWIGGTAGFYWGCNNTKDVDLRLEAIPSVQSRPANVVFHPSDRDQTWQRLYHKHKGKIGVDFGFEAFTTPPLAAFHSLDAKFTTTDLAKDLKSWALFGPPLGRTWEPTFDQRKRFPEIKPLVSNPWTVLHGQAPPKGDSVAVDLPGSKPAATVSLAKNEKKRSRTVVDVPAWHGTLLPLHDHDTWLASAFAEYERIVARDLTRGSSPADQAALGLDLFAHRSNYLGATKAAPDIALENINSNTARDEWYRIASGKGVLLLHELRRQLGDGAFEETMDAFGRAHAGKKVCTAAFEEFLAERFTKDAKRLAGFLDAWLSQTGLPSVRLGQVNVVVAHQKITGPFNGKAPLKHAVQGDLLCSGTLSLFKVDLTVETDQGEITNTIALNGATAGFAIDVGTAHPRRLILDKYGISSLAGTTAYSITSFTREQDRTLIVYGTLDETPTNREAAESLQKLIRESGANFTIPIRTDKEVGDADLKSHHLLLIGRPDSNAVVARLHKSLPITFGSRTFIVQGKTYANAGSGVVVAAENPSDKTCSIVVFAGLSAEATYHLPRRYMEQRRTAEVLVLPATGGAEALVLPPSEFVRELK